MVRTFIHDAQTTFLVVHFTGVELRAPSSASRDVFQLLARSPCNFTAVYVLALDMLLLDEDPGVVFIFAFPKQGLETTLQDAAENGFGPDGIVAVFDKYFPFWQWQQYPFVEVLSPVSLFKRSGRLQMLHTDLAQYLQSGGETKAAELQSRLIDWNLVTRINDGNVCLSLEGFKGHLVKTTPQQYLEHIQQKASLDFPQLLRSLNQSFDANARHPLADNFWSNFPDARNNLATVLYRGFNETVFDSRLPPTMEIGWNKRFKKKAGRCKMSKKPLRCRIELSTKLCCTPDRVRSTLLHEMCHAAVWLFHQGRGHGKLWRQYADKAVRVHPYLPKVTRCHRYLLK